MNSENPREIRENAGVMIHRNIQHFTLAETRMALKKMKNGKAVGPDQIPVEVWKHLGAYGVNF